MVSEDVHVPSFNGLVLTIAKIIKNVMSSAAEAEIAGLYIYVLRKFYLYLNHSLIWVGHN